MWYLCLSTYINWCIPNRHLPVNDVVLMFLLLTLNRFQTLLWCLRCWLCTSKCQLGWCFFVNQLFIFHSSENLFLPLFHFVFILWLMSLTLCEKSPNTEFFLVCIFLYSIWIKGNSDQKKYVFGHFSRCVLYS